MKPERWRQIEELFLAASELPAGQRSSFMDEACNGDSDLRDAVNSMLAADELDEQFIEAPAMELAAGLIESYKFEPDEVHQIGPYQLMKLLGEGGMGAVYLASRSDDHYQKQVAIKLVKRGLDNEDMRRRFRHERQILANLDHPNIAHLIDGGTTNDGRPFLVMDYVAGVPITRYCDEHRLSVEERLNLFQLVCAAVGYAHRNLVIHRDIKPSNIIVSEDATPKLLDFGIAKLLSADTVDPADETSTATVARIMTPQFASPEQVRGSRITTVTDIYSLGVILYYLLTGRQPYRFKELTASEIERVICESEVVRPSYAIQRGEENDSDQSSGTGLTIEAVCDARRERPESLRRKLKGDLDNIVLMALRKEPERRYSSVEKMADDIRRHLTGMPVLATNDSFGYRAQKFVRRNRIPVAAVGIVLLSLVIGLVATVWQSRAVRREKQKAESINAFLEKMLNYSNPLVRTSQSQGHTTTMEDALDEAAKRLENGEFDNQPEVKAEVERIVGISYNYQGRYDLAIDHLQAYVTTQKGLRATDDPKTLDAAATWGSLLAFRGDLTGSEGVYREVLPSLRNEYRQGNVKAEVLAGALNNFGYLRRTQGDSKEAEALFREALELNRQIPAESRYLMRLTRSTLASTIADQGRFDEALQTARDAVEEFRQNGQTNLPDFGFSLTVLGGFLCDNGDFVEADTSLREAESILRTLLRPSHLWLGDNLRNQGLSYYRQGRYAEALPRIDETIQIYLKSYGTHYDHYPTALITKGLIFTRSGKTQEGEALLREAVKLRTESLPAEHFWVALAKGALGECLATQKRYEEAEPLLVGSYNRLNEVFGEKHNRTAEALWRLVRFYQERDKPQLAATYRALLPASAAPPPH